MEGGNYIIAYNTFYTQGETGGDAINLKAGSIADICFNLLYSPNTNGLKLSNTGDRDPQDNPICYNNTIVNAGWRRPTVKGGGIWMESGVYALLYNNLHVNCRFGIKNNKKDGADPRSVWDYTYYYGFTQECVDQFQPSTSDVVAGPHDIAGTVAGENDPLLVNYPLSNEVSNSTFDTSWDFHLKTGSQAIGAGTTSFTRHFGTSGIIIDGETYISPDPSTTIGAFGTK
jgi:hypothetical protein